MMKISFEGIGDVMATFGAKSGLLGGQVCKVTAPCEAGGCSAGDRFCGVAVAVDNGLAAVQVSGFADLGYSGAVAVGWVKLSADGTGGVKTDGTNGVEYLVVDVDAVEKRVTLAL